MAILQNDPTIERIEPNGVTEVKEFVFEDNYQPYIRKKKDIK